MFEDSEGGTSWWKVILAAVVPIVIAVLGFLGARKFNWFGLGEDSNAPATGNGQNTGVTTPAEKFGDFSKGMPMNDVRAEITKVTDPVVKNRLTLMANHMDLIGKTNLDAKVVETGDPAKPSFAVKDAQMFDMVAKNDPKHRYRLLNYVSISQLKAISTDSEAPKYFSDITKEELQALQGYIKTLPAMDEKSVLNQKQLQNLADSMKAANPKWDKPSSSAPAPKVDPKPVAGATATGQAENGFSKEDLAELARIKAEREKANKALEGQSPAPVQPAASAAQAAGR